MRGERGEVSNFRFLLNLFRFAMLGWKFSQKTETNLLWKPKIIWTGEFSMVQYEFCVRKHYESLFLPSASRCVLGLFLLVSLADLLKPFCDTSSKDFRPRSISYRDPRLKIFIGAFSKKNLGERWVKFGIWENAKCLGVKVTEYEFDIGWVYVFFVVRFFVSDFFRFLYYFVDKFIANINQKLMRVREGREKLPLGLLFL